MSTQSRTHASKPAALPASSLTPAPARSVQRRCACGGMVGPDGECAACKAKRLARKSLALQRRSTGCGEPSTVPPIVHDVLRSPGQALDPATRAFMEPRFGHSFSAVRVHTDVRAAASAAAVNALAYTAGQHIVFGSGQYAPGTSDGRRLLAHELAHVAQQRDPGGVPSTVSDPSEPSEKAAENTADSIMNGRDAAAATSEAVGSPVSSPALFRRVAARLTNCAAGTNGAPADPVPALAALDARAEAFASMTDLLLTFEAAFTRAGLGNPASTTQQAFRNRFGIPPARPGGFLNRLTGVVRPTQDQALSEEMDLLSRRFGLIARMFSQFFHYRCIGGASTFAGCAPPHCNAFAWSCPGIDVIFLCPMFWGQGAQQQAGILIHEAAHINWTRVGHGAAGPGGNFRHAECYASFVADIFGFPSPVAPCPPPPP